MQNAECRMKNVERARKDDPRKTSFGRFLDSTFCILHSAFGLPGGEAQTVLPVTS
jgi:hypothetical protein